jgi:probable rRNA maturation factor
MVIHKQMDCRVPRARMAQLLRAVTRSERKRLLGVEVIFTSNAQIQKLNRQFRRKDKPTDVLSFPLQEERGIVEGEIYISVPIARQQARAYAGSFATEVCRLFLHALLHLYGFDHMVPSDARQMRAREKRYWRAAFGVRSVFPE